jgi:hypothetical protein
MWRDGDKPDISMAGVPKHIQRRWQNQVEAAGFKIASVLERKQRAQDIAEVTGRDMVAVYDELYEKEVGPRPKRQYIVVD